MDYEARLKLLNEENDALREENLRLKKELGIAATLPVLFNDLTGAEGTMLSVLMANKAPRRSTFMAAIYGNKLHDDEVAEVKIIDVFMCKLRKKIEKYGVEIKTIWGGGYYLSPEHKEILKKIIEAA